MRLVPADSLDFDTLLRLFNDAYSDYVVPMQLDRAGLEYTIGVCDIDLAASRIALDGEEPAAFAFLAVRAGEGWIGGMGTAPAQRRRGLGEAALTAVIDEARSRGAGAVLLEVIAGNAPAIALYEKLGFEWTRDLVVWVYDGEAREADGVRAVPEREAHAWIVANRASSEPWQRADETLSLEAEQGLTRNGLVCEDDGETAAAVLWRPRRDGDGPASVLQIAARDEAAAAAALGSLGPFRLLNAPAGEPASRGCELLGAHPHVRQHEMRLTL